MTVFKNSISNVKLVFLISLLSLTALSLFTYRQNEELIKRAMWVNHTNLVKMELSNHLSYLKDAETGYRGFLLSKDSAYLEPYNSALINIPASLKNLHFLVLDNAKQTIAIKELGIMSYKRLAIINEFKNAPTNVETIKKFMPRGKLQMDIIRAKTALMIHEEERLLNERTASLNSSVNFAPILSLLLGAFAVSLLVFSYFKILHELKKSNDLQKELLVSNEILEKSNTELAQFAYIASHDLQEPLRKIQTFVSRIEDSEKSLTEKGKDSFERINKSAKRMQQLILDILSYSRLNNKENDKENIELLKIVEAAKYPLDEYMNEKKAAIIAKDLPVVNVVKYQFEQLFTNLISNAIKFAKGNTETLITISSKNVSGNNIELNGINKNIVYHCITVADNGIGFEPQYQEKIFSIFNRLHTKEEYEGNGIGLSIVKKIMDAHNGFVTATGVKGEGATFNLYLPV